MIDISIYDIIAAVVGVLLFWILVYSSEKVLEVPGRVRAREADVRAGSRRCVLVGKRLGHLGCAERLAAADIGQFCCSGSGWVQRRLRGA